MRSGWLAVGFAVFGASCSVNGGAEAEVFEDEDVQYEALFGEPSSLPSCAGEGFCLNAVAQTVQAEPEREEFSIVLTAPNGDDIATIDDAYSGSVSPSGTLLEIVSDDGSFVVSRDGRRRSLESRRRHSWLADDWMLAYDDDTLEVLDGTGNVVERIDVPTDRFEGISFADASSDRNQLLFMTTRVGVDDSGVDRRPWHYDRTTQTWSEVPIGEWGFVALRTTPGFGPEESTVIVQVGDRTLREEVVDGLEYRIISVDLASGEVTTLEASTGDGYQLASVSPDGQLIAVRGLELVRIVSATSGEASAPISIGLDAQTTEAPSWTWDSEVLAVGRSFVAPVTPGPAPALGLPVNLEPPAPARTITILAGS